MSARFRHFLLVAMVATLVSPLRAAIADDAVDLRWMLGNWNVSYNDRALGHVEGQATVRAASQVTGPLGTDDISIHVKVTHPHTGAPFTLDATDIEHRLDTSGDNEVPVLTITLYGKSPWGNSDPNRTIPEPVVPHGDTFTPSGYTLRLPSKATLKAQSGSASDTIKGDLGDAAPQAGDLVVELRRHRPEEMSGSWSYPDPGYVGMRGRRAGVPDRQGYSITGQETWTRPTGAQITSTKAIDLDYRHLSLRTDLASERAALQAKHGKDLGTVTWLEIVGQSLPTEPNREVKIRFDDPLIKWTGERKQVLQSSKMRIRVALMRDVRPDVKKFTLNGAAGQWTFAFPDTKAEATCLDMAGEVTQLRRTGERFRLELKLPEKPFYTTTRHLVMLTTKIEYEPIELRAEKDDPRVFRSVNTFVLADPRKPDVVGPMSGKDDDPIPVLLPDAEVDLWEVDSWAKKRSGWFGVEHLRNVTKPEILVYRPAEPGVQATTVYAWDPIRVEVIVPRAVYDKVGHDLEVTFKSKNTKDTTTLTLGANPPAKGPVTYKAPAALTLREGGPGGGEFTMWNWVTDAPDLNQVLSLEEPSIGDTSGLKTTNDDRVTVSYENASTTFTVFDTSFQHQINNYRDLFTANARNYTQSLVVPGISSAESERAKQKLQLVENVLKLLDHKATGQENYTDFHRLAICTAYEGLLKTDPASMTRSAAGPRTRFGVTYVFVEEGRAVGDALGRGQKMYRDRTVRMLGQTLISSYRMYAAITGAEAVVILIFKHDAAGQKVNETQKWMAGLQLATQFLVVGALTAKTVTNAKAQVSSRNAKLAAALKEEGLTSSRYQLFNRPMTGRQAGMGGGRPLGMRRITDSGEVMPSGHPARQAATTRIQSQRAVVAAEAKSALERLGLDSANARTNVDIWLNHGLTKNEIIAGASSMYPRQVSPTSAMRSTGMSRHQFAAALDRYFQHAQGVRDPGARMHGIRRAMGDATPGYVVKATEQAGTQAMAPPAPPRPQPAPAPAPAGGPNVTPAPPPAPGTGTQAARMLEELGMHRGVADVNAHVAAPRGLTTNEIVAGVAAQPGSGVNVAAVMRRTGMSANEVARAVDNYYKKAMSAGDAGKRAQQVRRFMGDRTPDEFRGQAKAADSKPPSPPRPPSDPPGPDLPPGFKEAPAKQPTTTIIEPPPKGAGSTAIEAPHAAASPAGVRAQSARAAQRLEKHGFKSEYQEPFARLAIERGMTPDEFVATQLMYRRGMSARDAAKASGLTPDQVARGLDRFFERMNDVKEPYQRAKYVQRLMGDQTPSSYKGVRAEPTAKNVQRAVDHAKALELDSSPLSGQMKMAIERGLDPDEAFAGWAMYGDKVPYKRLRQQTQLPRREFASALDRYLETVAKEADPQVRARAIRDYMGKKTPSKYKKLADGDGDGPGPGSSRSANDDASLGAAMKDGTDPLILRKRSGLSPSELAARLDRHLETQGMTDPKARAQALTKYLGDETPPVYVERAQGGPRQAMDCAHEGSPAGTSRSRSAARVGDDTLPPPSGSAPRVSKYNGKGTMENVDFVDANGQVWKVGEKVGEGKYFDVYRLRDDPSKVIKFAHNTKSRLKLGSDGKPELGPDGDWAAMKGQRYVVEDTVDGAKLVRDAGVETPQIHAAVSDGSPFMVVDYLDPAKVKAAADYVKGGGLSPAQQRAVLRMFKRLGAKRIIWEDNHQNNVYLRKQGDEWVAGIYDTDRMVTLDKPAREFHANELHEVGGQIPGRFFKSLGGVRKQLPNRGDFWAERMLEYKQRWIQSSPDGFKNGALDLKIVNEPEFFPNLQKNVNDLRGSSALPPPSIHVFPAALGAQLQRAA